MEAERWLDTLPPSEPAVEPTADDAAGERTRPRIIIADDNADMRDYVRRLLGARWEVRTARDGRHALDVIAQGGADLVITDVMMPELDGFGLLRGAARETRPRATSRC